MQKEQIIQQLESQRLVPLYFHESAEVSINILKALYAAGVRLVEYTSRGEKALGNFREMKKIAKETMPDLLLGIGTIKQPSQANDYISAGADFIICPTINPQVAEVVHQAGLLWVPGCMTPTEVAQAEIAGAKLVKLFPGNLLGSSFISTIKELFPGLKFMPTGGVEAEEANLKGWFKAGAVAVGMGSKLITSELVKSGDFSGLTEATQKALALVQQVANSK